MLLSLLLALCSCSIVEVASLPKNFKIKIVAANPTAYTVFLHKGAGVYGEIAPSVGFTYDISIPAMRGGYKQFLFFKYNQNLPEDYKVILIKKAGAQYMELSIHDVELLDCEGEARVLAMEKK